jgi:hypothetical protein
VQSIASGLEITWPNEPDKARPVIEEFLRPRHRHYQIDTDPDPPHLGRLTTRTWEAIQHGLDGNEAAAQGIFDEINASLEEVDRVSFPGEKAAQRRLLALEAERNDLRDRLANSEATLCEIRARLAQADEKHAQLQNESGRDRPAVGSG